VTSRWFLARLLALCVPFVVLAAYADGPGDNQPGKVRPVPPPGVQLPDAARKELQEGVDQLGKDIDDLKKALEKKPALLELLPDVQIYYNSVRYALTYSEIYIPANTKEEDKPKAIEKQLDIARKQLRQGNDRAAQLKQGVAPWTAMTGPVARGYVSRIDGSVQPYVLWVPASFQPNTPHRYRLDVWCHGRGENLTEMSFLETRASAEFGANTFVLYLYGRYCCANKFAGEIDCLEAMDDVQKHYPIDTNRRSVRGFSMGGAACWQFAVHYPGLWAAAAPGAGFSETTDFLDKFQNEKIKPNAWEQKLLHWYDCTDYAVNLFNLPTVAYSGEIDKQKQAADMMEVAMKKEGLTLVHLIGPKTAHAYHPQTKVELNRRIDKIVERGREPVPSRIKFTTWTLRYNECFWLRLEGLERHWERATADGQLLSDEAQITTTNVTALAIHMEPGSCPLDPTDKPKVTIDTQELTGAPILSDRSWDARFQKNKDGKWESVAHFDDKELHKRHGLQGPIDDAFMDSFLMVQPSGKPMNEKVGQWTTAEMEHAVKAWRAQFRGEARVKADTDLTDADIAAHNLVLWGDPSSNKVLAKIADKLPIRWGDDGVQAGKQTFKPDGHAVVMVYPNPLNPKRYVVLNSGFTFREYDYLNNARQIPRLPDYAVIDLSTPANARTPGGIATAGFFDDDWKLAKQADK
jgi:hypothetical protein